MNHFMPVADISKALKIAPSQLYSWAKNKDVPTKTSPRGIKLLSLDAVKEKHKKMPQRPVKKVVLPKKARPATKQADQLTKLAAVLEIFFPGGIPVKQYLNALILAKALDAVTQ